MLNKICTRTPAWLTPAGEGKKCAIPSFELPIFSVDLLYTVTVFTP